MERNIKTLVLTLVSLNLAGGLGGQSFGPALTSTTTLAQTPTFSTTLHQPAPLL